jgi:hypothetical protein
MKQGTQQQHYLGTFDVLFVIAANYLFLYERTWAYETWIQNTSLCITYQTDDSKHVFTGDPTTVVIALRTFCEGLVKLPGYYSNFGPNDNDNNRGNDI